MTRASTAEEAIVAAILAGKPGEIFAITGPAGSGKSTAGRVAAAATDCTLYSADFRFIGDSAQRRLLLDRKQSRSPHDYRDSANQYNWWNWPAIDRDLADLAHGKTVVLEGPYDRETGRQGETITIEPRSRILFEGALLGPPSLVDRCGAIFFLCTPAHTRLDRIFAKDSSRRSFNDVLARFLITEYSETIYYRNLFEWSREKLTFIDTSTGRRCAPPALAEDHFIPLRVTV